MNRILTSPNGGGSYDYDHDILGFRTWRNYGYSGVQRYLWDEVGRLKSCVGSSAGARYEYRADGMRIKEVEGLTIGWNGDEGSASGYYTEVMTLNAPTERYWYDGQMAHEEDRTFKVGSTTYKNITKYGLGARGMDYLSHFDDQTDTTTVAFPIYDGHGNMIATLSRSGSSPYYSVGNLRLYDVWGSVRSGSSTGLPNQRYCANLGHRQDDESSLIYMRARYYEPGTGRFISQDRARSGANWYAYCGLNPVSRTDSTGNEWKGDGAEFAKWVGFIGGVALMGIGEILAGIHGAVVFFAELAFLMAWIDEDGKGRDSRSSLARLGEYAALSTGVFALAGGTMLFAYIADSEVALSRGQIASKAVGLCLIHAGFLLAFMAYESDIAER